MPKRKPREVTGFEKLLAELIEAASPGRIVFTKTRPIFDDKKPCYELEIATRGSTIIIVNPDLEDSLQVALHDLNSGELDPMRPAWSRVSRLHREVVIRTLQSVEARHMAPGAKAKLGAKYVAGAEYAIADAFHAALSSLWNVDDYDEWGEILPGTPKLDNEGPLEPIHIAKPPKRSAPKAGSSDTRPATRAVAPKA